MKKNILIDTISNNTNKTKTNIADVSRLINLIDQSLTNNFLFSNKEKQINVLTETKDEYKDENEDDDEDEDGDEIEDKIKTLKTKNDFIRFKERINNSLRIRNYVVKHLFENINEDPSKSILSSTMKNVKEILLSKDEYDSLITELLADEDDVLCDYPNFESNIHYYM